MYKISSRAPIYEINESAKSWWNYNCLAAEMERKEYNTHTNTKWKYCNKNNPKKMWDMIDWKGKSQERTSKAIDSTCINNYFTSIFQSKKTLRHPTVNDIKTSIDTYSSNHYTNSPISMDELKVTLRNVGRGTGLDGIPPSVCNLFPQSLCNVLLKFIQTVFSSGEYPTSWTKQVLLPIEKKGHTISSPKLRGIAISSVLPRIYDTIINNRFSSWFHPNKEQAGFRPNQGCTFQLFYVVLLIEMASYLRKDLYLLLVDYEKAFDFSNRAILLQDMMEKNIGDTFVRAIAAMYRESIYVPKTENNMLGDMIKTYYGVTQGRRTSTNFFSFLVQDMPTAVHEYNYIDFMDDNDLAQLADDTILASETRDSLKSKFESILIFSFQKKQFINIDKTKFIHMSPVPDTKEIITNSKDVLESLEVGKSIPYLGMHLLHTNKFKTIVEFNLNKRMYNIAKFKSWLEINKITPFPIKLLVLDNCVLSSIVYGFEAWGDLTIYRKQLETIELDLLKAVLCVKKSTPSNIVYHELKRGSIVDKLIDRQKQFINKISKLNGNDALVKNVWDQCHNLKIHNYYSSLKDDNYTINKINRTNILINSNKSMDVRYRDLIGLDSNQYIYNSFIVDIYRTVITRWRLSSFSLAIETGRHKRPIISRELRLCKTCLIVEDEEHVLFECPAYQNIRNNNQTFFNDRSSVRMILNPDSQELVTVTGKILLKIEELQSKFNN